MTRRKVSNTEQLPIEQPVAYKASRRQREASRNLTHQRGYPHRNFGYDRLELRMGLRVQKLKNRPWYVISNPGYHEVLNRCPQLDDSLGGPSWLSTIYGRHRDILAFQCVRDHFSALLEAERRHLEQFNKPAVVIPKVGETLELFA